MSYLDLYTAADPLVGGRDADAQAAIFGVPFDSTHSYRPGTRFGPNAIRESFNNIEVFHDEMRVNLEEARIADYGNLKHTVDSGVMLEMVGKATAELVGKHIPIVILGGEHLITLASYAAMPSDTAYIVFDAHYDLRDSYADAHNSHASYLRRIIEARGTGGIIHVGARAYAAEEAEFLAENKITTVTDADIRESGAKKKIADVLSSYSAVYASFDLDVVDPAYAPGVGNPEACGITSRELFSMIGALAEKKITCADIVELNPSCDNGSTSALAAKILSTIIAMQIGS